VTSNKTQVIPHVLTKNTSLCSYSVVDNILNLSINNITSHSILENIILDNAIYLEPNASYYNCFFQ